MSVHNHNQAKFMTWYLYQETDGEAVHGKTYSTIINGQSINIVFYFYAGDISADISDEFDAIINTISFSEVAEKPEESTISQGISLIIILAVIAGLYAIFRYIDKRPEEPI